MYNCTTSSGFKGLTIRNPWVIFFQKKTYFFSLKPKVFPLSFSSLPNMPPRPQLMFSGRSKFSPPSDSDF